MSNLRIQPGEILWLERNEETKRLFGADGGILGHPVVILGIGVKGDRVEQSRHIQINIITSFGGQLLQKRHPGDNKHARYKRSTYIPIHRPPWPKVPHPDTNQVLPIETVGNPKVPGKDRTSYLSLREPIYVGKEHLAEISEGKANLTFKALQGVVKRVNAICIANGAKQVPAPIDRPRKFEEYTENKPAPVALRPIIELDSSSKDSDSNSPKIPPNNTVEPRWCGSCQEIHYSPTSQASTAIPDCRPSRVPLGQRNRNTAWESNQSAARTPTVQAARPAPVPRPAPPISQRDPLLEEYYRNPSNFGSINGPGSRGDLETGRQPRASWSPESNPNKPKPTPSEIATAAIILGVAAVGTCAAIGYVGYRLVSWVIVEGKWVVSGALGALRGLGELGYRLVKWVIVEGEWVLVEAREALRWL